MERSVCAGAARFGATVATDTVRRYLQSTADPARGERKINRPPKFIRDKFANDAGPISGSGWGRNWGAADLLPFDRQPMLLNPIRQPEPPDGYPATVVGQCAIF